MSFLSVTLDTTESETKQHCVGFLATIQAHAHTQSYIVCPVCKLHAYISGLLKLNEVGNSTVLLKDLDGQ